MIYTLFLLAFLLSGIIHASPFVDDEEKIIGGQNAIPNAFPWEVSLGDMRGVPGTKQQRQAQPASVKVGAHSCGGVLLNKDWVLTAAHCVVNDLTKDDPLPASYFGVGMGSQDLIALYDEGRVPISRIIIHKGYQSNNIDAGNDIALLQLRTPVNLQNSPRVKSACLAQHEHDGFPLMAIGWGNTSPLILDQLTGQWLGYQMQARMKQVAITDLSRYRPVCQRRRDLICIKGTTQNHGPCKGDSGGSLIAVVDLKDSNGKMYPRYPLVVGITSYGDFVKDPNNGNRLLLCTYGEAYYTRISQQLPWITSIIGNNFCAI